MDISREDVTDPSDISVPLKDEDSGKKLHVAIFNLISLGEWEAASSIIRSLYLREETRLKAKQLLRALVVVANDYWKYSVSIPSPSHLSWLSLQLFVELFPDDKNDIPDSVEALTLFMLTLFMTRSLEGHTPDLEEFLCDYFKNHVVAVTNRPASPPHLIPSSIQAFLRNLLHNDPCLGHTLLRYLTVKDDPNYLHNNEALQMLYIESIDVSLGKMEGRIGSDPGDLQLVNIEVNRICNCLSLMDPIPEMTRVIKSIDRVLVRLLQFKYPPGEGGVALFTSEVLYSCLVGRICPILVQRFQDVEEFVRSSSDSEGAEFKSSDENTSEYWKGEFYQAVKQNQHFLERAMDSGLKFISSLQLDSLHSLMSDPLLNPLKPLLLLMGWDRNPDIGKGKHLLDLLWPHTSDAQPLLYNGCCKLAFQIGLVQWCLDKAGPFLPMGPAPVNQATAGDVFQGLKSHSVLYVLHHSTPLHSLDPLEVIDILKLQPESSLPASRRPSPSPGQLYSASPRSPTPVGREGVVILTPDQRRDIATFRGFCTLKLIMEAAWSSVLLANGLLVVGNNKEEKGNSEECLEKNERKKSKAVRKLNYGGGDQGLVEDESLEAEASTTSQAAFTNEMYASEVSKKLEQAKTHLSEIFPLHFRLEILENIFSLLFISNDDLSKSDPMVISVTVPDMVASSASHSCSDNENDVLSSVHSLSTFIRKQQGFLMNESLALDLLTLLNDAIFELTATKFALLNNSPLSSSKVDSTHSLPVSSTAATLSSSTSTVIVSSIHPSVLQQRMAKLQKCINEAKWRLQLVSSKSGLSAEMGETNGLAMFSDEESLSDISDSEDKTEPEDDSEPPLLNRKGKVRSLESSKGSSPLSARSRPSSRGTVKTPSSIAEGGGSSSKEQKFGTTTTNDDDSSGHCADVEEKSPKQKSKESKRNRKKSSSRLSSNSRSRKSTPLQKGSGIICQMLASPSSLLCKCLKHSNYNRAREVLKMFNMEGELGDQLVQFAEQFEVVGQELQLNSKGSRGPTPRPSPSSITPGAEVLVQLPQQITPQDTNDRNPGLSIVQAAVLAAQSSSPNIDPLHRLIAPANIQDVVFAGNTNLPKTSLDLPLICTLLENTPSLIMLDILASNRIHGQTAKEIINKAVNRSKDALDGLSPKIRDSHPGGRRSFQERKPGVGLDKPLLGPLGLLHLLSEVTGYFVLPVPLAATYNAPPTAMISSPHSLLTQFTFPLQISSIQQWKEFSDAYWDARDQLQGMVDESHTSSIDVLDLLLNTPMSRDQLKVKNIFDDVSRSMKQFPVWRPEDQKGVSVKHHRYLHHVGAYLMKFVQILMKTLGIITIATPNQVLGIIQESPTELIGRLLFEKEISPDKLEKLVSDLPHLKIVEVIVKCCCPKIPSYCQSERRGNGRGLPKPLSIDSSVGTAVYPLNIATNIFSSGERMGGVEEDGIRDPCELSNKLLSKMIATLKGVSLSENGHVTIKDMMAAAQTTEMKKVLECTSHLSSISLATLKGDPDRQTSFYCNITNLLYAHALMKFLQEEGTEEGRRIMGGTRLSANVLQSDKIAIITFFTKVGYYIGELGLVSLYDLHFTILRQGLSLPVLNKENSLKLRPIEQCQGPWLDYIPTKADPRVLYVVSNGTRSSPLPKTLSPDHLQSELAAAEKRFIRSTVLMDPSKYTVKVPKLLSDHRDDFIARKSQYEEGNAYREISNSVFIQYIMSKHTEDIAKQFTSLNEASDRTNKRTFSLEIIDEDLSLGYIFPSSRQSIMDDDSSPILNRLPIQSTPTRRYERLKSYNFTKDTVGFVRQQVPLLASLVCLLCPPESLSNVLDLTGPSDSAFEGKSDASGTTSKQTLVNTISGHVKPPKVKDSKQRIHSITDEAKMIVTYPSPEWQETFDKLLSLFNDNTPLKNFLISRLKCFKGLLPWDRLIQEPLRENEEIKSEDPSINMRTLAVLPGHSPELEHACVFVLRKLLRNGLVNESLRFLSTEPVVNNRDSVQSIGDVVCSACFVNEATSKPDQSSNGDDSLQVTTGLNPIVLIYQLSDIELGCRLVLSYMKLWPANVCVQMLQFIHYRLPTSSPYVSIIDDHLYRLNIYQRIVETVEAPDPVTLKPRINPWSHWSRLVYDSKERKDFVLTNLLANKAFSLARDWARVHEHGDEITEKIEIGYIHDLLEGCEDESDPYTAQGVLEDLFSNAMKLKVCEGLLKRCHKLESIMLILQFILGHLASILPSSEQISIYANQLLGAKALLTLPHFVREQYRPLMGEPLLIVEQLLIDLKTDWIGRVIKVISKDEFAMYLETKDVPVLDPRPSVLTDDVTDPFFPLIMFYAEKSLMIPSVSVSSTPASSRGHSPSASATPFRPREKLRSPTEPPSRYSTVPPTPRRKSSSNLGNETASRYNRYEPPAYPPPRDKWEPDSKANYCRVCTSTYFGMFNRRHHCRRCGRVVCRQCSNYSLYVEGYVGNQKVCRDCHNHSILISGSTEEDFDQEDFPGDGRILQPSSQYPYQLIFQDPLFNQNLRREFIYDSSPSISLCLSIVDLITDTRIGARFLLHCCHNVSMQLVPDDHGRINEEIDHYFTIGMMENLLINAKIRFTRVGDISGVELCDTYISRVDLLRLLVSSQFSEIPSIQELTRPELARRVRDRLIGDDRYKLAMEVSTKCQLDASPVWSAWGMACIRVGEFAKARDLLKHCFQVSSSISSSSSNTSYLLERVIEQIIACPLSSVVRKEDWFESIKATNQLTDHRHEIASMDTIRFRECCYYLMSYGSPSAIVAFYSKHQCWRDACQYILRNNCSPDVFVESLWMVAIKFGHLENLEEMLRVHDPSLVKWEPHMNAVCRLLSQRRLYQILYRTQLFMKDYVRAAMTCIKFFIGSSKRSTTIQDMYQRRKFLETAKQHFEASLESPSQNKGRVFGRFSDDQSQASLPKNMTSRELQMHIHTVCMQLKITEMLYVSAKANNTLDKPLPIVGGGRREGQEQPATLFSSGVVRGEVICNMLSSCQDIAQGFQIAFEAISAYRLPVNRVFVEATRQLATRERYPDIRRLLQSLQKSPLASKDLNDEVCVSAIKVLATQSKEVQGNKQLERLVEAIHDDRNKIKALIQCGKLKNAYLVAINAKLPDEVRNIADVASKAGQLGVKDICEKWLQQNRRK